MLCKVMKSLFSLRKYILKIVLERYSYEVTYYSILSSVIIIHLILLHDVFHQNYLAFHLEEMELIVIFYGVFTMENFLAKDASLFIMHHPNPNEA
jgi:hypothetical protein